MLKNLARACAKYFILTIAIFSYQVVPVAAQTTTNPVNPFDVRPLQWPFYDNKTAKAGCAEEGGATLTGKGNQAKIWNFLTGEKGLTPMHAAGIMGSIDIESAHKYSPFIQEIGKSPPIGGYGIVQWTGTGRPGDPAGARRLNMIKAVQKAGLSVNLDNQTINRSVKNDAALSAELDYLWKEATERGDIAALNKETTIKGAVDSWIEHFERPASYNDTDRLNAAKEILAKYGSGETTEVTDTSAECGTTDDGAFINDDGYAWPVALSKAEVSAGYPLPCTSRKCHHDGTPAFDLAHKDTVNAGTSTSEDSKSTGRAVYAIADGSIYSVKIYKGISGCYAIQYKASDGYIYWYGHLRKPATHSAGKKFDAGDKIAEIGERKCTANGSYPHLHIDRGSPKGEVGGRVCCRDDGINDVINNLYKDLP